MRLSRIPRDNAVRLFPHLYSDEVTRIYVDRRLGGTSGPRFKALGVHNKRWHDVEVIVTPEWVTARWNGQPFSINVSEIQRTTIENLTKYPPPSGSPARGTSTRLQTPRESGLDCRERFCILPCGESHSYRITRAKSPRPGTLPEGTGPLSPWGRFRVRD